MDDGVKAKLAEMEKANPAVKFTRIFASVDETRDNFRATQHVLMEGMVLAASHGDASVDGGLYLLEPGAGAQPGMRLH